MDWEMICNVHDAAQNALYVAARADYGALMGDFAWLRNALSVDELNFFPCEGGFEVTGYTFTNQTQSFESFRFVIPMSVFEKYYEEQ